MKRYFNIICAFLLLFVYKQVTSFAQVYNVNSYSVAEGLIQSQVEAILQDQRGYLWLGTHRGVCRFDGRNFLKFQGKGNPSGFIVNVLVEDKKGVIWVGSDKGLTKYQAGAFHNISFNNTGQNMNVEALFCDSDQNMWIGTLESGLYKYSPNGEVVAVKNGAPITIYAIAEDDTKNLYLASNDGLYKKAANTTTFVQIHGSEELTIQALLPENSNSIWLATNKGIWKYEGNQILNVSPSFLAPDKVIHSITREKNGTIWFGTEAGVVRYYKGSFSEFSAYGWNKNNSVATTFYDREGDIWFGTDGVGLFKIRPAIIRTYNTTNGLNNNIAKSFLEDKTGNIWISTTSNGINILSDNGVKSFTNHDGLAGNDICYSFKDSKGNFWFGSYNKGVSRYSNGIFQVFNETNGLRSNACYCIAEDRMKNIWFGTSNGIAVWDGTDFHYLTTTEGLSSDKVYSIYADRRGYVWVGTADGLNCIKDFRDVMSMEHYSMTDGLSDNFVLTILEDTRGWIWVATRKGISVWDEKKWNLIDVGSSPESNDVVSMVFENSYKLWVGTNDGVFRLDLARYYGDRTVHTDHFSTTDGLPSLECNGNAAFKDTKGNIWIGTIAGAACFPMDSTQSEAKLKPITHITNVRLSFMSLDHWDLHPKLDSMTQLPVDFVLSYTQNHLTFDFIGISHQNPNAVRYQFKLDGFDKNWQPITDQTFATYNNLEPGVYTFHVRSSIDQKEWSEGKPFTFTIESPFWLRWWFILGCVLTLGIVGYGIWLSVRLRIKQKREQQRMKDQAEMLQLEHQALYAMMNPHFTFNALQSIQYFIHSQDKLAATKFLGNFAKLVRMNLDSSKSEFIALKDEVERLKLYLSLEKMRFHDKFSYAIEVEEDLDSPSIQIPPMILQPFVENSIKHGIMPLEKQGEILVKIEEKDNNTLLVSIRDNGIGLEASKQMRRDRPSDHVSKGMQITKDRLKLFANLRGKDYSVHINELKNEQGEVQGTEVTIYLPMKD